MYTKAIALLLFIAVVTVGGYYFYTIRLRNKNLDLTLQNTINTLSSDENKTEQDSVPYTLPQGEQTYNVSHGKETKGPKMNQVVFSPLSYKPGESQKIKMVFPEKEIVGSVVLFVTTDNKENQKVSLTKDPKTNTWIGEWTPDDTVNTRYSVKIVAVGAAGEYNNTMTFL